MVTYTDLTVRLTVVDRSRDNRSDDISIASVKQAAQEAALLFVRNSLQVAIDTRTGTARAAMDFTLTDARAYEVKAVL